jgi:argininosuccinate lyase
VKGLPLAYNRDLQEDKPPLFDSVDTVKGCLRLAAPIVAGARLNRDAIARHLETGHLDATTFMEYLIGRGMPQRTAHHRVGQLVRKALDRGVPLGKLSLGDFQEVDPDLDEGVYQVLGARKAIESFASYGSTAPKEVRAQIERWKKRLESN